MDDCDHDYIDGVDGRACSLVRKSHRGRKWTKMIWLLGIIVVFMFIYLTYVLLNPEKF